MPTSAMKETELAYKNWRNVCASLRRNFMENKIKNSRKKAE